MSDGHGSAPETPPPGWAAEQPPPYGASPWAAPGSQPQIPPVQPYQQQPPPPPQPQQQFQYQQPPPPGYGYMPPPPPPLRPGIIPLRPLNLGDLLDGTIKLVRSNPKAVLGLSAGAALLAAIPVSIGQALLLGSMGDILTNPNAPLDSATTFTGIASSYGGTFLSMAISFVVVTLLTGVLTRILGRAVFGGKITAGEAWRLVKGRIGALFGVVLLLALLMLAPLLVFVPIAILASSMVEGGSGAALGFLGIIGVMLLLYIPYALFINARFSFATPAVVLEGKGPIEAMKRSWNLVTGDFWRVLGILVLTSLIAGLVSSVLSVPFTFIGTFAGMLGGGSTGSAILAAVLIAIGATLGAMITYPLQAGVAGLLYTDRRMRSEAFDLVLQTAAIEQQRQGWVAATADELWHSSNAARP